MMRNKKTLYVAAAAVAGVLAVAGCKQDAGKPQSIDLPDGQLHLGSQWLDGKLWVESFDPRSATCTFSEYRDGKAVDATTVTFKNCRTGLGGPVMRPMMQQSMPTGRGEMMRPDMPPRPGMARPGAAMRPGTASEQAPPAPVAPPVQD